MKIGILTFHYSINQGSVIQAYCVQNLLKEQFPNAAVEVINLIPLDREKDEFHFYYRKFPFISFQKIRKFRSIRKFVRENLNLSKRVYYNSMEKQIDYINKQNYDLVCTGSDTVWFNSHKLNNQIPTIYFLPNSLTGKKISFAASLDPLLDEGPYLNKSKELIPIFNSYDLITVRDNTSHKLISKLTNNRVEKIVDPTILFDFENRLGFAVNKKWTNHTNKIVAIGIADKKLTKLFEKKFPPNYTVINIVYRNSIHFDYVFDEFNSYSKFDIIITDRFHRSIFALKLSSALVINVERSEKNKIPNSKGRDLFTEIGIPDFFLRFDENSPDQFFSKILKIIHSWNEKAYLKRENKFNDFITAGKFHWQKLINQYIKDSKINPHHK